MSGLFWTLRIISTLHGVGFFYIRLPEGLDQDLIDRHFEVNKRCACEANAALSIDMHAQCRRWISPPALISTAPVPCAGTSAFPPRRRPSCRRWTGQRRSCWVTRSATAQRVRNQQHARCTPLAVLLHAILNSGKCSASVE